MILVMLAGLRCSSPFFSYKTVPVDGSISTAPGALISGAGCTAPWIFTGQISAVISIRSNTHVIILFFIIFARFRSLFHYMPEHLLFARECEQ